MKKNPVVLVRITLDHSIDSLNTKYGNKHSLDQGICLLDPQLPKIQD